MSEPFMIEVYKLVYRGEVLEGQHAAVVRRKLGQLLSIDEPGLDRLFSGQPVVVKSEADAETATRYQGLFRKAGARLRVVPLQGQVAAETGRPARTGPEAGVPTQESQADASPEATQGAGFAPELLPAGSDVLREDERERWHPREIDTAHLSLQDPGQLRPDTAPPSPPPPDTSRLRLLDPD